MDWYKTEIVDLKNNPKCEVCLAHRDQVVVVASSLGAFSYAICYVCARLGLEPLWAIEFMLEHAEPGEFRENLERMREDVESVMRLYETAEEATRGEKEDDG